MVCLAALGDWNLITVFISGMQGKDAFLNNYLASTGIQNIFSLNFNYILNLCSVVVCGAQGLGTISCDYGILKLFPHALVM